MKKPLASGLGALCSAAVLVALLGSGTAAATNDYAGSTYDDAASSISGWGGTPVIASRIGDYLPTGQCVVTGSRNRGGQTLLDLNCNATSALEGHPGNSVVTPEGRKVQALRNDAATISEDFANAVANGSEPYCASDADTCWKVCDAAGTCSAELVEYLGG